MTQHPTIGLIHLRRRVLPSIKFSIIDRSLTQVCTQFPLEVLMLTARRT